MSTLKTSDSLLIETIFQMGDGWVLNFNNDRFSDFFRKELGLNIDDPAYAARGGSKAKRLRCFLDMADDRTAARTLTALWEYREAHREYNGTEETVANAGPRLSALIARLGGSPLASASSPQSQPSAEAAKPVIDRARLQKLEQDLLALAKLVPQPRGYAFETFLKELFDAHGLHARQPFRNRGEQIDGSFQLAGETYLLEAKWQNAMTGVGDLRSFNGKVAEKVAWARGLFISYCGFSPDGLAAFGGKQIICMDGYDLSEALRRGIPLSDVIDRKVRRAVETGAPFVRIADLFS